MENNSKNGKIKADNKKLHITSNKQDLSFHDDSSVNHLWSDNFSARGKNSFGTRKIANETNKKPYKSIPVEDEPVKITYGISETEKRRRIERQRKQARVKKQRLKISLIMILAVFFSLVLMFMTPLFNIREIRLSGNDTISKDMIIEKIGDLVGENIFKTSKKHIEEKMTELPQVNSVEVKKNIIPSYIEVVIFESKPAAYFMSGNKIVVIDSDLRVIDDATVFNKDNLAALSGISVAEYEFNQSIKTENQEKTDVLYEMLKTFEATNIIGKVTNINIDDLTSIKFNYDNRLDVLCGSPLELEQKIRMFTETIKTSAFSEHSLGTIDMSIPGQGLYEP